MANITNVTTVASAEVEIPVANVSIVNTYDDLVVQGTKFTGGELASLVEYTVDHHNFPAGFLEPAYQYHVQIRGENTYGPGTYSNFSSVEE